jgi:hemoglobin
MMMTEKSLYERLGGVFAVAAVVDHSATGCEQSDCRESSENPALREWHTKHLDRLSVLKFMRTLWVCSVAGGPFPYTATKPGTTAVGLEEAHRDLSISPRREKQEVFAAFTAHKSEVRAGAVIQA